MSVDRPVGDGTTAVARTVVLDYGGLPDRHTDTDPVAAEWAGMLRPPVQAGELGRLGPYRVLGVLGRGGMGVVFLAEDPHLGRRIALKTLHPGADRESAARFVREARAQAAVEHDHVIAVHQVGEDGGVPYLAMPLLQGRTLAAVLADGQVPVAEAVRVGAEIADGLAAAHARGLVHRDVKPSNVWLEGDRRRVKLLDFGLARASAQDVPPADETPPPLGVGPLTELGMAVGTPAYMSPEQTAGLPVDARTDLFSLGAVLYQAVTGDLPFDGPDPIAVMAAVRRETPPPPAAVNPAVPKPLSDLIVRLLAKELGDRPASAAAVATELRQLAAPPPRRRRRAALIGLAVLFGAGLVFVALPRFGPGRGGVHGPGTRLADLVTRAGGRVQMTDGRWVARADLPPPPHHPAAVVLPGAGPRGWPEVFDGLVRTDTLTRVDLAACPLTDAELATLAGSPTGRRLEELALTDCPNLTPGGLRAVGGMTSLRRLRVAGTGPLHDAARRLAEVLPGCRIEWPGGAVGPAGE